jgi:hypothetical protein
MPRCMLELAARWVPGASGCPTASPSCCYDDGAAAATTHAQTPRSCGNAAVRGFAKAARGGLLPLRQLRLRGADTSGSVESTPRRWQHGNPCDGSDAGRDDDGDDGGGGAAAAALQQSLSTHHCESAAGDPAKCAERPGIACRYAFEAALGSMDKGMRLPDA